jgi:hypothetical protein
VQVKTLKAALDAADLSSRGKRRKAAALAAGLLERVRATEQGCLDNVPDNFQGSDSFAAGEEAVACLDEIIGLLVDVY